MAEKRRHLPFPAIVGHDLLKTIYLANIVDPWIGGLLITGPKGTGKSTIVHSVNGLLPDYEAVSGCLFHCDPTRPERLCSLCRQRDGLPRTTHPMRIVTLPLSCTEDRLIGSIDVEALLHSGKRQVQEGILGQANRNILYVDEVNLLPDHLADDILDAAASRWNTIEREGISVSHPAEFVLVGTMNPEEGDLRPQILDRFPLSVRLESIRDPGQRVEIVKRNLLFEQDPEALFARFAQSERALRDGIAGARTLLPRIAVPDELLLAVASACAELKVDGQRPDIVIVKTARAIAALAARSALRPEDLLLAAEAALVHRTRDGGLLDPPSVEEIRRVFERHLAASTDRSGSGAASAAHSRSDESAARSGGSGPGVGEDGTPDGDEEGRVQPQDPGKKGSG